MGLKDGVSVGNVPQTFVSNHALSHSILRKIPDVLPAKFCLHRGNLGGRRHEVGVPPRWERMEREPPFIGTSSAGVKTVRDLLQTRFWLRTLQSTPGERRTT